MVLRSSKIEQPEFAECPLCKMKHGLVWFTMAPCSQERVAMPADYYRDLLDRLNTELWAADAWVPSQEVDRLRERIIMLLRCHYDEHQHRGSPTCFDVQSPTDEWETAALARPNCG